MWGWGGCTESSPDRTLRQKQPRTSLKMIHTGESVWMDSRIASSGPKEGSTSPSATPLEKEPGGKAQG